MSKTVSRLTLAEPSCQHHVAASDASPASRVSWASCSNWWSACSSPCQTGQILTSSATVWHDLVYVMIGTRPHGKTCWQAASIWSTKQILHCGIYFCIMTVPSDALHQFVIANDLDQISQKLPAVGKKMHISTRRIHQHLQRNTWTERKRKKEAERPCTGPDYLYTPCPQKQ